MKRFLFGALAATAALAWFARYDGGTGTGDDHEYRWIRFDVGDHILELHLGSKS